MSHFKSLWLLALAVLMVFAGTASATTVTSPTGTTYATGSAIEASSGATNITGSYTKVECASSTMKGKVEKQGAGVTVAGNLSSLTFGGCNYSLTVLKAGALEVHAVSGSENGTLTWNGGEFSIHTSVGQCVFTTNGTDIGVITGGVSAKLDIASAKIPRTGGNFLCGSSNTWNVPGGYTFSTPGSLYID